MTTTEGVTRIENHLHREEYRWFAVYTRYKGEKMAFRQLSRKGIQAYLPLQKLVRQYTRKVKTVELPLISCYVFVRIIQSEYVKVLETEQVVDFVRFSRNLISIPEREIDIMRRILGEGWEVTAEPGGLHKGDEVEIVAGNLTGLHGRLLEEPNRSQVLVNLDRLGYTLRMSIDKKLLRKTNDRLA
ncbi:MAG: UpxY family transcription antiterminator [Bacteroidetes bacterium]|nr:UpxY family transcription antiterminator [Bacteroidota bacterium]